VSGVLSEVAMRPMRLLQVLSLVLLSLPLAVRAQTPADDEAQIRAIVQSETDAWNRGDAEAFGAHYAENGSFTNVIGQDFMGGRRSSRNTRAPSAPSTRGAITSSRSRRSRFYGRTSLWWRLTEL
jgi:hypothetical protein